MSIELKERIKKQLDFLDEEQRQVKIRINQSEFDCTTAPYVMMKQYRESIKKQMELLRINLEN